MGQRVHVLKNLCLVSTLQQHAVSLLIIPFRGLMILVVVISVDVVCLCMWEVTVSVKDGLSPSRSSVFLSVTFSFRYSAVQI